MINGMKIGVFDSGLGGLILTDSFIKILPQYDFIYLGDTARVPYGNRSQALIYEFSVQAIDFLFKQDCGLIIVACNTASAEALHKLQTEYLPKYYPKRKILGVLIPAAEAAVAASQNNRIGLIGTLATVKSSAFDREIHKLRPAVQIFQQVTPLLVPLVESGELEWADMILAKYLKPLIESQVDTLILGCTHYPALKTNIRQLVGDNVAVISQDEVVAGKLRQYLERHAEIDRLLAKDNDHKFFATDVTMAMKGLANKLFSSPISLTKIDIPDRP